MEPRLLGWPADGPTLRLDYRRYAYAGKFVVSSTGKAVLAPEGWEPARAERGSDVAEGDITVGDVTDGVDEGDDGHAMEADVFAAVSFDEDRTDPDTLRLRYVTVRDDRRGEGLAPRLCAFVADRAAERGYERVRIAVNNPYSYEALHRAGFGFARETTGLAEVVLERPAGDHVVPDPERYRAGLDEFAGREDLTDDERAFLREKFDRGPPDVADGE